jgi:hypothetical protein
MATALSDGKIYLIESDAVTNQDWITNNAGDPDAIDLDSFTDGTEYCHFDFPLKMVKRGKTGITVETWGAAKTADTRSGKRFYNCIIMGKTDTRANAWNIGKFIMADNHVTGASTFERYYLIIYYGTNDHEPFTDASNARLSYCTGIVSDWEISWAEPQHINMDVRINWWSVF